MCVRPAKAGCSTHGNKRDDAMKSRILFATAAAMAAALPGAAEAMGCNGIVNPTLAGCGRSDNNDGASFPYFKLQRVSIPSDKARIEMVQGTPMVNYGGKWAPVLATDRGNLVIAAGS
jgi:hypothetical protein